MEEHYIADKTFEKKNFAEESLAKGEYENCSFTLCNFSGTDLSEIVFIECVFISCNLSMTKLAKTVLRDVKFTDCKMLGLRLEDSAEFCLLLSFQICMLNDTSF